MARDGMKARTLFFLVWPTLALASSAQAAEDCVLPPVSADTEIVLLGTYEAHAQSSVTLGLQDNEVRAGTIVVAPGDRPLALIVSTYDPTIWQIRGAVRRVAWVVATSFNTAPNSSSREKGPPLAGVTGLPADRVRFLVRSDCLRYWGEQRDKTEAIAFVTRELGRAPDVIAYNYAVSGFGVPGGEILDKPYGVNVDGLAGQGTVVTIDPMDVVGSQTPISYETLPGGDGLRQLVKSGALVPLKTGEFRVTRKIRFPAGLYGAGLAKFWLAKGVPVPDGDPGHSCVMSEETGKPLFGICR
jgi:hypothetical protein